MRPGETGPGVLDGTVPPVDLATFGQRLRHFRLARGLTLAELGATVDRAPSTLSALEHGKREPKLSLLRALSSALDVTTEELLSRRPPNRRAELTLAIATAEADPALAHLDLPPLTVSARLGDDVLEYIAALYQEVERREAMRTATPEEAREANATLRQMMRETGNYFREIERAAGRTLDLVDHRDGPLSQALLRSVVAAHGFTVEYAEDLPWSVRSIADLRHRRIYLRRESVGMHTPWTIVLQTVGHIVLGHERPASYLDFLRQRIEANYFAAAILLPERSTVPFLRTAKQRQDIAVEDLRDLFSVSYEMACHRLTNLATEHLDITCHFIRNDERGIIYKAYENDGLAFPTDPLGAIEGQRMCRGWAGMQVFTAADRHAVHYQYTDAPDGTHFCIAHVDPTRDRDCAITLGVPYVQSRWFRGRESTIRRRSHCPAPECCRRPSAELTARWEASSWPSARVQSHVLAALPPGTFPGVDQGEVYAFLERHAVTEALPSAGSTSSNP